jgi:hypothetical protein
MPKRQDIGRSAGRYSASDQQDVPDYRHGDHKQGRAGEGKSEQARRPWRGRPYDREGQYGYRRDGGADGRKVDGVSQPPSQEEKDRPEAAGRREDRWADVRPTWRGWKRQGGG